ncbi:MAG: YceI family protein [Chitinophagaceae bacterium]
MKIIFVIAACLAAQLLHAQTLKADASKSKVSFSIKNFGLKTDGSLTGLQGNLEMDPVNAQPKSISLSVDANTINTDNKMRDNHLRKADYFDVAKYPRLTFSATSFSKTANGYLVIGTLTIKGTTKNIEVNCSATKDGGGMLFKGSFPINRRDFKVGGGSISLSDDLTVNFQIQFIQ